MEGSGDFGKRQDLTPHARDPARAMTAMAKELQLSVSRISRLIAAAEAVGGGLEARGKRQDARPDPARMDSTRMTPHGV